MSALIALIFEEEPEPFSGALNEAIVTPGGVVGTPDSVVDEEPLIAKATLKTIEDAAKQAHVKLEDAVIVHRGASGDVKIKQTKDITAGKGARRGTFWGLMAGLLLGGPIGGLLWGLGIGAVYGASVDHGIDDKFLKNVGKSLTRRNSAVLVMVEDKDKEAAVKYLSSFEAKMYVTDMSDQAKAAAEKAAENEEIAKAVDAEYGEA